MTTFLLCACSHMHLVTQPWPMFEEIAWREACWTMPSMTEPCQAKHAACTLVHSRLLMEVMGKELSHAEGQCKWELAVAEKPVVVLIIINDIIVLTEKPVVVLIIIDDIIVLMEKPVVVLIMRQT